MTDQNPAAKPLGANPWPTFWIASLVVFMVTLDATAIVVAFPSLREAFGSAGLASLSWSLNAYTIAYAALLVPAGRWADKVGRKRAFHLGLALFCLSSLACAFAPSLELLIAARAAQAAGAAMLTPSGLALVLAAFPPQARGPVVGLFGAIGALAAAFGPAFGSWLVAAAGWRWIFLVNLPIGVLAWAAGRARLRESASPETGAPFDVAGSILLAAGAALLTHGLVSARAGAGNTPLVAGLAGLGLLVAFRFWAKGKPHAAIDLTLFERRSFLWVNLASLFFGVAFSMMFLTAFLCLSHIWGYPEALAGLAMTPGPLAVVVSAVVSSRLVARVGFSRMVFAGGLVFALGQALYALRVSPTPDYLAVWLPAQLATGIGIGMVLPGTGAGSVAALTARNFAMGGAVNNALRQFGGAAGAALAVALVGSPQASFADFQLSFEIISGLGLLTAALGLRSREPAAQQPAAPKAA